jgi:chemotaxis protein CheD
MPSPSLSGIEQRVVVGIADLAVSNNPTVTLSTYSLGSCIGVSIYDPETRVGGMLHAMLADSRIDPVKAAAQPAMFVDTGVATLFRSSYQLRADKHRLVVCVAGCAQIMDNSGFFNIGKRNYEALTRIFQEHRLHITAEQVGGLVSRSMYLNLATGEVRLKVSGQPNEMVLCRSLTNT